MKDLETNKWRRPIRPADLACLVLCFTVFCIALPACYEPIEGCLDPDALNFGLDADRECDGCCTYPQMSIRLTHVWTDADTSFTMRYSSTAFEDGSGNPFSIERITYYLKDFALLRSAGAQVYTTDTVLVQRLDDAGILESVYVRDDYLLINPGVSASRTVGTLRRNGLFSQLRFRLGIDAATDRIVPTSLPDNHPLSLLDSTMYDLASGQYLSNRLDLYRDTTANAAELFLAYGSERLPQEVVINLPPDFDLPPGFNVQFVIEVNYAGWFSQVQAIDSDPEAAVLSGIVAGLANSFKLLEIRLSRTQF